MNFLPTNQLFITQDAVLNLRSDSLLTILDFFVGV